jgi:hypothetical protein
MKRALMTMLPIGMLAIGLSGCASYNYAQNVKLVGFQDNIEKGTSIGNIRGEDCTWNVLGYQMGGLPTVDKAFISARNQSGNGQALRYANNVTTSNEGFSAGLFGKKCIVVKGVGYR